jgi:hypothetical protein
MLDFLVVASTFEFVTHLKFKIFKINRKQDYKSKEEIKKRKKSKRNLFLGRFSSYSAQPCPFALACWAEYTPLGPHYSPFSFFSFDTYARGPLTLIHDRAPPLLCFYNVRPHPWSVRPNPWWPGHTFRRGSRAWAKSAAHRN